jgi:hypothetical protein
VKVSSSQWGASSSGIPPQGTDSSSQPGEAEKTTGGRDSPVVRNLPIKVTSLGSSSSGIPPQGASIYGKPVYWEPVVPAYHHGELAVLANLWTGNQQFWHTTTRSWRF